MDQPELMLKYHQLVDEKSDLETTSKQTLKRMMNEKMDIQNRHEALKKSLNQSAVKSNFDIIIRTRNMLNGTDSRIFCWLHLLIYSNFSRFKQRLNDRFQQSEEEAEQSRDKLSRAERQMQQLLEGLFFAFVLV